MLRADIIKFVSGFLAVYRPRARRIKRRIGNPGRSPSLGCRDGSHDGYAGDAYACGALAIVG